MFTLNGILFRVKVPFNHKTTQLLYVVRRRRAAENDDDSRSTASAVVGTYLPQHYTTEPETVAPPPDAPLHQDSGFPTASNITEEQANERCRGAVSAAIPAQLYDQCLNFTAHDTEHYVTSCVQDIQVT